jgi:hypothetical protein
MTLLDRFPILVWAGAALLGWIVGETVATDHALEPLLAARFGAEWAHGIELMAAAVGAVLVLIVGELWRRSKEPTMFARRLLYALTAVLIVSVGILEWYEPLVSQFFIVRFRL